jgi:hypothetical protein
VLVSLMPIVMRRIQTLHTFLKMTMLGVGQLGVKVIIFNRELLDQFAYEDGKAFSYGLSKS